MLEVAQKYDLVEKLEKCGAVKSKEDRDRIVNDLPPEWTGQMKRHSATRADLHLIVTHVDQYENGVATLIKYLSFFERNSLAMQEVERLWSDLSSSDGGTRGGLRPRPESATTDPDTRLAQELHWDRDTIVQTFVGMVKGDPRYAPWRILALEGPEEAGLSTLLRRLEHISEQLAERSDLPQPLLHAKMTFDRQKHAAPRDVAKEILRLLQRSATEQITKMEDQQLPTWPQLRAAYSQVEQELAQMRDEAGKKWRRDTASGERLSKRHLAGDLTTYLRRVSQHCAIVLLFENLEQLEDLERLDDPSCRDWFLKEWLDLNIARLENTLVVVTGQSGMSEIDENRLAYHRPNLPTMSQAHLLEWAQQGWGLTRVTRQQIELANRECRGNPVRFLTYLRAWAIGEGLTIPESCA